MNKIFWKIIFPFIFLMESSYYARNITNFSLSLDGKQPHKKVASTVKKNLLPKPLESKLQMWCHIIPNKNIILQIPQ